MYATKRLMRRSSGLAWLLGLCAVVAAGVGAETAWACGGFFCQQIPINQAGEQIIFRQDGDQVTAVILIQ